MTNAIVLTSIKMLLDDSLNRDIKKKKKQLRLRQSKSTFYQAYLKKTKRC